MPKDYTEQKVNLKKFTCPRCGVYAEQDWLPFKTVSDVISLLRDIESHAAAVKSYYVCQSPYDDYTQILNYNNFSHCQETIVTTIKSFYFSEINIALAELSGARCSSCEKYSYWLDGKIIYPAAYQAPEPNPDMPENCRKLYKEAQGVADKSPRAAAALLRLCLETLLPHIGEKSKNLSAAIANLVKEQKISPAVQQYLDICRVIGNQAVHPAGELQINDEPHIALCLFDCLNMIVKEMISDPNARNEFYQKLPENSRKAIAARDNKTPHNVTE